MSEVQTRAGAMQAILARPEAMIAVLTLATAAVLGTALISQFVFGLQPCILCLYQRVPYAGAIALGVYALVIREALGRQGLIGTLILLAAFFVTDAGVAVYHVGVEQKWWQGTAACGAGARGGLSLREFLALPVVRCDEPGWTLFGVSMAGYNVVAALGLAALAGVSAWRARAA